MGRSKLSNDDKLEIRRLFKKGVSIPALASRYDVAYVTIKRVVNPEFYAESLERAAQYNKENAKHISRQASKKYRHYNFRLHREKDNGVINFLDNKENLTQYIRELVTADMPTGSADNEQ